MTTMKMMARTNEKSYLNGYKGEDWAEVTTCYNRFSSGRKECVKFPSGFECRVDRCEVCYVYSV